MACTRCLKSGLSDVIRRWRPTVRAGRKVLEVASLNGLLSRPLRLRVPLTLPPTSTLRRVGVACSTHLLSSQPTRINPELALQLSLNDWYFRSARGKDNAAMQSLRAGFGQRYICSAHHARHPLGKQADASMCRMLGRGIDDLHARRSAYTTRRTLGSFRSAATEGRDTFPPALADPPTEAGPWS